MDFNERVIPGISSNFMFQEGLARYVFASKYAENNQEVIDLGCGTGYGEEVFSNIGSKVVGIDISTEAIKFAKKMFGKYAKFQIGSIEKTGYKANSFDLVVSFEVIEHLENSNIFVKEIKKILKKDGTAIISTPNTKISSPGGKYHSPYHKIEFDYKQFYKLLNKEFSKVQIYGQTHSNKAKIAWKDFLKSQTSRSSYVQADKLGIRKLIPKSIKEKVWKLLGSFYGRGTQESLTFRDFPVTSKNVKNANYLVAVCQK